jgi:hypothetical protein
MIAVACPKILFKKGGVRSQRFFRDRARCMGMAEFRRQIAALVEWPAQLERWRQ